ncbi:conserved hypothetical protein [Beggiatoa sp. SS]|nr:conserved hypothetical protein [Beggiatoa sp. SS]
MWTTNPLFQKTNGSYYWYQTDHLGTPQKLIDSQGNVVWAAVYEAFGKARVDVNLVENHLRFAGQYFDSETRLHYNYYRYYEPTIGRYLRVDPIPSVNQYAYVSGNPLSYVDPFGLEKEIMMDQLFDLFDEMAALDLAFDYPKFGCEARTHIMVQKMLEQGYQPYKVWLINFHNKLSVKGREKEGLEGWGFHVAPMLLVKEQTIVNGEVIKTR